MPTHKIIDFPQRQVCPNPEHNPPNMIVLSPGAYEHECPLCHNKIIFIVPLGPTMESKNYILEKGRLYSSYCDLATDSGHSSANGLG